MNAGMLVQVWSGTGKAAADFSFCLIVRVAASRGQLLRRLAYVGRLAYWTARHRSLDTARWVVEYEGLSW